MPDVVRSCLFKSQSKKLFVLLALLAVELGSCSRLSSLTGRDQPQVAGNVATSSSTQKVADLEAEVSALRKEVARLRGTDSLEPATAAPSGLSAAQQPPVNLNAEIGTDDAWISRSAVPRASPPADASLVTGSVRPPTSTPGRWIGEIPVTQAESRGARELMRPKGDSFALLLGSFADQQNLRPARAIVLAAHGDLLAQLHFRSELISLPGKRYYNLVAGPFGTESEGAAVCREIENRGAFCKVAKFRGTPLE